MSEPVKERLLDAAGPIFAEKGFQDATVREICHSAGVNVAAVNYHFGDKERLYVEAVKRAARKRSERVPMPDWPPGTEPEVRLRDFIHTLVSRMMASRGAPWQSRLMLREILGPTGACRELVEQHILPQFELLRGILSEMLPNGTPDYVRDQVGFSVIGQCFFYRAAGDVAGMLIAESDREHFSSTQIARHVTAFTLAALGRGEVDGTPGATSGSAARPEVAERDVKTV